MKLSVILAALAGVLGAAYLVAFVGFDAVWNAVASVGWLGFAALILYGAVNFILLGTAWSLLLPPYTLRRAATLWWSRGVRDSAGDVLPFSQLGGMVIGARAAALRGLTAPEAFGSTIVDITVEMVSQICFILVGIAILMVRLPLGEKQMVVLQAVAGAIIVGAFAAGGFVVAQRKGFDALEKISARFLPKAAAYAADTNRVVGAIHRRPRAMVASLGLHLTGWIGSGFATWLSLVLIGHPFALVDAVAIEALMCALRSAVVFVPGAYGVQEAGYALLMPLFGLPADIGLAISLLKRAREIGVGAPILFSWQLAEGSHAAAEGKA